jgi:hypothetical protein
MGHYPWKTVTDEWKKKLLSKSRKEIVDEFQKKGYDVKPDTKFWRINNESVGMEIGRHEHSCHIDTIELIVLLIIDYPEFYYDSYIDLWLEEVK